MKNNQFGHPECSVTHADQKSPTTHREELQGLVTSIKINPFKSSLNRFARTRPALVAFADLKGPRDLRHLPRESISILDIRLKAHADKFRTDN